jgi:hypothetical protein
VLTDQEYHRWGRAAGERRFDPARNLLHAAAFTREIRSEGRHLTRDSMYFARILLDTGEEHEIDRACRIIEAVMATQVIREGSPVRGNFPWFAEDGEAQVWDPNWACFIGQTLLEILRWHGARLPEAMTRDLCERLRLCAEHDLARWVSPAYTNVALLTVACLSGAGRVLNDDRFTRGGRDKLCEIDACVKATGSFDEYNSPTYSAVNLRALASVLELLTDQESLDLARGLWRLEWKTLLDHAHMETGQLVGPHGRAYGRDMLRNSHGLVKFVVHRVLPEFPMGVAADNGPSSLFPALITRDPGCPSELLEAFRSRRLPSTVVEVVDSWDSRTPTPACRNWSLWNTCGNRELWREYVRSKGVVGPDFHGKVKRITSYLAEAFCLGTASEESMGDQAAPLIAHWPQLGHHERSNYLVAVALQRDGESLHYLSGGVFSLAQQAGRVLGVLTFGPSPEGAGLPAVATAMLGIHVNRDGSPNVVVDDEPHRGRFQVSQIVVIRSQGISAGFRILDARIPGADLRGTIGESSAPHGHEEGELAIHFEISPLALQSGQAAFVAFSLEITQDPDLDGLMRRLRDANAKVDPQKPSVLRLSWEPRLSLETSIQVPVTMSAQPDRVYGRSPMTVGVTAP